MKKLILTSLLVFVLIASSVFVEGVVGAQFQFQTLRYEPSPTNPGEYFDLWLKVQNIGGRYAENATFELVLEYPFSLHPEVNAIKSYGAIGTKDEGIIVLEYKLKVDESAVEGTYEAKLKASTKIQGWGEVYHFNITVENVRTDFEVVVQESSDDVVSLAIANTGKNAANSVTIKIPEQENFRVIGVSNSIVGNINPGDYTIVSFQVQPATRKATEANLEVQIDYTDIISKRRIVMKSVPLSLKPALPETGEMGEISGVPQFRRRSESLMTNLWFWVSIALLSIMVGKAIYGKVRRKSRKEK